MSRGPAPGGPGLGSFPALPFIRNVLLWMIPAALLWLSLVSFLNLFLMVGARNLLHLGESPNVTRLTVHEQDRNYAVIWRDDFPPTKSRVSTFRVTDIHYPLILLLALFLAVPGVPWKERLKNLAWALLVVLAFSIVLTLFWVKFIYATQLGRWSLENYGPLARNVWGLGKHILDLPIKLGLPLGLWGAFYFRRLKAGPPPGGTGS